VKVNVTVSVSAIRKLVLHSIWLCLEA
jgi:hypothetical protein